MFICRGIGWKYSPEYQVGKVECSQNPRYKIIIQWKPVKFIYLLNVFNIIYQLVLIYDQKINAYQVYLAWISS